MDALRLPADDFRAFSDPMRLRILHLLRQGELCVGDLVSALDVRQPAASRHLAYLRRAKLVQSRWRGPWRLYSLVPAPSALQRHLLEALPIFRRSMPLLRDDLVRLLALRKSGGCCPGEPCEKQ
jgi:ArsR family transcriptional regulator